MALVGLDGRARRAAQCGAIPRRGAGGGALLMDGEAELRAALSQYEGFDDAAVLPLGRGLINRTYEVRAASGRYVLQRVSKIFDPAIHVNIRAVTARLLARG